MPVRLVIVYGTTTEKLHTNLPTVPILDPVIQSPTKCCFNIHCDVTKCRSNMYHLLLMCSSYTKMEKVLAAELVNSFF